MSGRILHEVYSGGLGGTLIRGPIGTSEMHTHAEAQVSVVLGATAALIAEGSWGRRESRRIDGDSAVVFEPRAPHAIAWGLGVEVVSFYASLERLEEISPGEGRDTALGDGLFLASPVAVHAARSLRATLRAQEAPSLLEVQEAASVVFASLRRGATTWDSVRKAPALSPREVKGLLELIEAGLELDLSLGKLAAFVGLSPFHFARSFRRATGRPPHKFVLERRLLRARLLLVDRRLSLAEIAQRTGFSSQAHLSTAFGGRFGISPGRLRRQLLGRSADPRPQSIEQARI